MSKITELASIVESGKMMEVVPAVEAAFVLEKSVEPDEVLSAADIESGDRNLIPAKHATPTIIIPHIKYMTLV